MSHTKIARCGMFPIGEVRIPTTPAINATTVIASDLKALSGIDGASLLALSGDILENFYYGGVDTPTTISLARRLAELEGGHFAILTPSGQSAVAAVMFSLLGPGDHVLVVDTTTYTTRWFFDHHLVRMGIGVEYYAPQAASRIVDLFRPNTKLIFMESPGSLTYEVLDIAKLTSEARSRGIYTVLDNTWSASSYFRPFPHGVDISVLSLTKSHGGQTSISLGAIVLEQDTLFERIKSEVALCGLNVSSETCAQALVSLSTLGVRLEHQAASTASVIAALRSRPDIQRVFHPCIPDAPDFPLWQRYYSGYNSLVTISFNKWPDDKVERFVGALRLFNIGHGWGGVVSLVATFDVNRWRTVSKAPAQGTCVRLYVGLEAADDLVDDLNAALDAAQR